MTDWERQIASRTAHAHYVITQAIAICDEHPAATIAIRSRLAAAAADLFGAEVLLGFDDRGLEFAEDVLERVRQVDDPRVIRATDSRLARATAAVDWVRKAIKGERG